MSHIVFVFFFYLIIYAHIQNVRRKKIALNESDKEKIQACHLFFCYIYSAIIIGMYGVEYGVYPLIYASIFNLIALEYYWSKFHYLIDSLKNSITYTLAKYYFPLLVIAFCAYSSSMILEEITKVPASTMASHVSLYTFGFFVLISLMAILLLIEFTIPILMLKDMAMNKKTKHISEDVVMVLIMSMAPMLICLKVVEGNLFNDKFIRSMLYESYHSNVKGECPNISVDSRFHWISTDEISTVKYDEIMDTYNFDKSKC
ncbi:hypothetical protein VCSRO70_3496 [Vibrio cholerae]|uniref:hypothetical protein n=3 Tax=Vibrio cholerae TaxID=666 RepID=UPI0011410162|nr:hypothetical protein [Vibrio cholerae]EGR2123804.1 hypothetical protein [Vibrio cholerae]EHQ2336198.1 hypothetical protein [Vibrio cholerae]EJL6594016.1 hypothetical protein [Vibrio cholerae]EJL6852652.1 hypothetical protein [Vibrio cholerae]EJL6898323.1 hypothetical protein [Vibrio cholerae]